MGHQKILQPLSLMSLKCCNVWHFSKEWHETLDFPDVSEDAVKTKHMIQNIS